ncbi:unnamed protein product, partial [Didymodactylos carnosus]
PSYENISDVFSKFKNLAYSLPGNIARETSLEATNAYQIFGSIRPIWEYVKDNTWQSILKVYTLPQILESFQFNIPEKILDKLLSLSSEDDVMKTIENNKNGQGYNDEQKSTFVKHYISKINNKLNPTNFHQLIIENLGMGLVGYLPLDFIVKNNIFNDNNVLRDIANYLHLMSPLQKDALATKVYHALTSDSTSSLVSDSPPLNLESSKSINILAGVLSSLSPRQVIKVVGNNIGSLLNSQQLRLDTSCTTALGLLNRTIEAKRIDRNFKPDPQLLHRWQECYSGCDLSDLLITKNDIKELLRNHPNPVGCERLINEVKKEYDLENRMTTAKLRSVADVFGSLYRPDEISSLSQGLMADLGTDETFIEKLGQQDLDPNEARAIINKIPRHVQEKWNKNILGKLGNLIPGLDDNIITYILQKRGNLPTLFSERMKPFIRKLSPSKIRLLIDKAGSYATEASIHTYKPLVVSDYAKKFISSATLMRIINQPPDIIRFLRFTPAQAAGVIQNRFDGSLHSLSHIGSFLNGLTKNEVEKIKPEDSLQAVRSVFGSKENRNIDNAMQSGTRYAFGNVLQKGLKEREHSDNPNQYIQGLFREDDLVEDLNPQIFATMTNAELDAVNRLKSEQADKFWKAVGSINEPVCCSFVQENRVRLTNYALSHYGSNTGEIDVSKLSQLGPFLTSSLPAKDLRRITTDGLMNKLDYFKSPCFQPSKEQAQALGSRLNNALNEVDDKLKSLYLDLIGELAVYLPNEIASSKEVLAERTSFLAKSIEKLNVRDERCTLPDTDGFLSKAKINIKKNLISAFIDSLSHRQRRQTDMKKRNLTCDNLRKIGSVISVLTPQQIDSIANDQLYLCIDLFGKQTDFESRNVYRIAQNYIRALTDQNRHLHSVTPTEIFNLGEIFTGFTPSQLNALKNQYFKDGNILSAVGNLQNWNADQLKVLTRFATDDSSRLSPILLENGGKLLCVVDDELLRRTPLEDVKSYLVILANIDCPIGTNYSDIMFDVTKNAYKNEIYQPHIFGSLGNIAAGLKPTDVNLLSKNLMNFLPVEAIKKLPKDVMQQFTAEQLDGLNIEQIKAIPSTVFSVLGASQQNILNKILYPFITSGKNRY